MLDPNFLCSGVIIFNVLRLANILHWVYISNINQPPLQTRLPISSLSHADPHSGPSASARCPGSDTEERLSSATKCTKGEIGKRCHSTRKHSSQGLQMLSSGTVDMYSGTVDMSSGTYIVLFLARLYDNSARIRYGSESVTHVPTNVCTDT